MFSDQVRRLPLEKGTVCDSQGTPHTLPSRRCLGEFTYKFKLRDRESQRMSGCMSGQACSPEQHPEWKEGGFGASAVSWLQPHAEPPENATRQGRWLLLEMPVQAVACKAGSSPGPESPLPRGPKSSGTGLAAGRAENHLHSISPLHCPFL